MADRFPLIANSSANQIQEIPSGDQLNLSGNNIANAGVVTATTFSGSGASLTNLNASNLASGTVPTARLGSGTANSTTFLRGDSTFAVVDTNLVADSSPQLGGNLDTNGSNIIFEDNNAAFFGTGSDLKVYHDGSNNFIEARGVGDVTTFKTSNSSAADTGALAIRANGDTSRNDNIKALFGNSDDLQIYYSGSNSFIKQASGASGNLYIQADNSSDIYIRPVTNENGVIVKANGAVELYENNDLKLRTGVTGDYGSIQLQNGQNGWYGVSCNGQTVFMSDGTYIGLYNDVENEWILRGQRNGSVHIRHDNSIKFETQSTGVSITGVLETNNTPSAEPYGGVHIKSSGSGNHCGIMVDAATGANAQTHIRFGYSGSPKWQWRVPWHDAGSSAGMFLYDWSVNDDVLKISQGGNQSIKGHMYPRSSNAYDLGSSSLRWRDVYTMDLNLSNEGSKNDVDGSWGSYTIQEGESDLFLINKRNGKKYKFNLTEVS